MARKEFSGNLVTTITGVILFVVTLLASFGIFTGEQASAIQAQIGIIAPAITAIISAVSAIILIFKARDN